MSEEKPGLIKRIFSFGFGSRKKQPETEPPIEEQEAPPEVAGEEEKPEPVRTDIPEDAVSPEPILKSDDIATIPEKSEKSEISEKRKKPAASKKQPAKKQPQRRPAKPTVERPNATRDADKNEPERPAIQAGAITESEAVLEQDANKATASEKDAGPSVPAGTTAKADDEGRRAGWFTRLRKGLARSSDALVDNVAAVFTKRRLDDAALQDLEDVLIQADLGVETAMNITDALSRRRLGKEITDQEIRAVMAEEMARVLEPVAKPLELDLTVKPHVILMVGVNGSGKTTTIGKLSAKLNRSGCSTLLVAGDTFRAAAIEQLKIWGERTGSPVAARELGADAAGLAFDAYARAKAEGHDVLLMDTAGRLQNKKELMAELEKIIRVLKKQDPLAPHTVLLTLDATTGQNALNQVEVFGTVAGVNGLVMTKLDGTARGGILVAIAARHRLPVYFIGVGEQVDDLEPFEARDFANSIAGLDSEQSLVETE